MTYQRCIPAFCAFAVLCAARLCAGGLTVGIEYCLLDNPAAVIGQARAFGELGVPGAKHYAEAVQWGEMQGGPGAPIDFARLDAFVREYQACGFGALTVCLRSHSPWASRRPGIGPRMIGLTDPTPRPEYAGHYARWIQAVVERYDGDGQSDMAGLRFPLACLEIGSELSSYEPEPVASYLEMLELAYRAAHAAWSGVRVAHAAFLPTPADLSRARTLPEFEAAFAASPAPDRHHGLADMRRVLDRPDLFDLVNLHPLGDPYEIEHTMRWLRLEMQQRGYVREVIASDTIPTCYVTWGPATSCTGDPARRGVMVPPATEADRCRLAALFSKLVARDPASLAWVRGFVAADHVQRTVIAAEQGLSAINLSFTIDLPLLTTPAGQAGAGLAAWGGMVEPGWPGLITRRFPNFYAVQQLARNLDGHGPVRRLPHPDPSVRVYTWSRSGRTQFAGWVDPGGVQLPGLPVPRRTVVLPLGRTQAVVEPVITAQGRTAPDLRLVPAPGGVLAVELTPVPIFVR